MKLRHPGKKIEIWAEDEARLGLQPVIRRQWFKVGSKPRACHRIQYKWIYAYGFVHPASGRTHWLLLPSVSCKIMQIALESFAREYVDDDTLVVLLWDRAGVHQTGNMQVPEGIEFQNSVIRDKSAGFNRKYNSLLCAQFEGDGPTGLVGKQ